MEITIHHQISVDTKVSTSKRKERYAIEKELKALLDSIEDRSYEYGPVVWHGDSYGFTIAAGDSVTPVTVRERIERLGHNVQFDGMKLDELEPTRHLENIAINLADYCQQFQKVLERIDPDQLDEDRRARFQEAMGLIYDAGTTFVNEAMDVALKELAG